MSLNDTGRYRELPCWRKAFKREWKKLANTPIEMPINPKYRPDVLRWVCTCPYFVTSRFLVCKHLVQAVGPVPALFYLQVKRNRTTPFWLHPILQPEGHQIATNSGSGGDSPMADDNTNRNTRDEDSDDEDDGLIDTEPRLAAEYRKSLRERFREHISTIRDFCEGLEYQLQFEDHRMLETLERDGASFLQLAQSCLSRERRMNSSRGSSPTTWERETARAMFYRTRPESSL